MEQLPSTRCDQLEGLVRLALEVQHRREPEGIAASVLAFAARYVPGCRAAVLAGPAGQLTLVAGTGLHDGARRAPRGASPQVAEALESGGAVRLPAAEVADDPWLAGLLPGAAEVVVVPLIGDARSYGALLLAPEAADTLHGPVLGALEQAATLAALGLRTAWQFEQVQRLAATDGLTKIANRRTFEQTLERELARSVRSGEPLSLVLLDVDHFKRLNDSLGHQAGDDVLRNVAAALSCECRDFDTAARYGGEEFAVVLPGCGVAQAARIAERLRAAVAAAPAPAPVTASAGIASFPLHARDAEGLVGAADEALYAAKQAGRDRSAVAPRRTAARGGLVAVP